MHCIILHFAPHALHVMSVSHICTFALDPAESKTEIRVEQIQWVFGVPQASSGEDTNLALDQDKLWCIPPKSLSFMFETLFIILYTCALSLQELYDTVAALRSSFPIILITITIIVTGH
jgi:hypothetical protein